VSFTNRAFRASNSRYTFTNGKIWILQGFDLTSRSHHSRGSLGPSHLAANRLNPRLDTPLQLVQALRLTHDM